MNSVEISERLAELEQRVALLEWSSGQSTPPSAGADDDPLWVLNGLTERLPEQGSVVYAGSVDTAAGPVKWQYGLTTEKIFEGDWTRAASALGALGSPVRLEILHLVIGGANTVSQLAELGQFGTTGQVYHHINQLVAAGWLTATSRGHYEVPAPRLVPLLVSVLAAGGVS